MRAAESGPVRRTTEIRRSTSAIQPYGVPFRGFRKGRMIADVWYRREASHALRRYALVSARELRYVAGPGNGETIDDEPPNSIRSDGCTGNHVGVASVRCTRQAAAADDVLRVGTAAQHQAGGRLSAAGGRLQRLSQSRSA